MIPEYFDGWWGIAVFGGVVYVSTWMITTIQRAILLRRIKKFIDWAERYIVYMDRRLR